MMIEIITNCQNHYKIKVILLGAFKVNNLPSIANARMFFISLSHKKMITTAVRRIWARAKASVWSIISATCVPITATNSV